MRRCLGACLAWDQGVEESGQGGIYVERCMSSKPCHLNLTMSFHQGKAAEAASDASDKDIIVGSAADRQSIASGESSHV